MSKKEQILTPEEIKEIETYRVEEISFSARDYENLVQDFQDKTGFSEKEAIEAARGVMRGDEEYTG